MKDVNVWQKINMGISGVALILSGIALGCSVRNNPFTIDFDSALLVSIATVISIPTAVLIGWQIYNAIKLEKIKEQTVSAKEEMLRQSKYNLMHTNHGLADFFAIRYSDKLAGESLDYYASITYRIFEIEMCSELKAYQMMESAIRNFLAIWDDVIPYDKEKAEENIRTLELVPTTMRTDDFNKMLELLRKKIK